MTVDDFHELYDFNSWANRRTLDSCASLTPEQFTRDLGSSFRSVRDTLAHIYGAEWLWLERWHERVPTALPSAADFPDLEALRARWAQHERNLHAYVHSLTPAELGRVIKYKNTRGTPFEGPIEPMLNHVLHHSTYHRGQIVTLLRQLGAKPVSTDLIVFYRERAGQPVE
ncbi:MAG TPA: DinB family protein [Candidatus Acidoferrales bacterium]|nr:DinB family protein [Candidatus Acidoferrales bacterium]